MTKVVQLEAEEELPVVTTVPLKPLFAKNNVELEAEEEPPVITVIHLKPLFGIRAICCLFIVFGHFFSFFTPDIETLDSSSVSDSFSHSSTPFNSSSDSYAESPFLKNYFPIEFLQAVTLFFLLSGISLARLYSRPLLLTNNNERFIFLKKRLARLAPSYYIGLLLALPPFIFYSFVIPPRLSNITMASVSTVLTPLFLQGLVPQALQWNGPLWQVSLFMVSYVSYIYSEKYIRRAKLISLYIVAFLFYFIPCVVVSIPVVVIDMWLEGKLGEILHLCPIRICHFFIGAILGELIERKLDTKNGEQSKEQERANILGLFVDGISLFFLFLLGLVLFIGYKYYQFYGSVMYLMEFVLVPLHCLWLYGIVLSSKKSLTERILRFSLIQILGNASYSIYCIHWPIFILYSWIVNLALTQEQFKTLAGWHAPIAIFIVIIAGFALHKITTPVAKYLAKILTRQKGQNS